MSDVMQKYLPAMGAVMRCCRQVWATNRLLCEEYPQAEAEWEALATVLEVMEVRALEQEQRGNPYRFAARMLKELQEVRQ